MRRKNLAGLAVLLREQAKPEHFTMAGFGADYPEDIECGTIASALGQAPMLFPAHADEGWSAYSRRVFGLCSLSNEWYFLFSPHWSSVDNTPEGAAKRIDYLLKHGCPLRDDITAMICGKMALCYE